MIAYVESNFALELARQQEEMAAADEILRLAASGNISLVFPVFAVCEPFSTVARYGTDRSRFVQAMQREARELGRLQPHRGIAALLQPLGPTLSAIESTEMDALMETTQRMLTCGRSISLTSDICNEARTAQRSLGLSAQDAIVYASVRQDLLSQPADEPKCFLSRNSEDFGDPAVVAELRSRGCRYIAKFADGLSYIRSELPGSPG